MNDVMLDLETLGTTPGCVVLSIGAVIFGPEGLGDEFYSVINVDSSKNAGMYVDGDTVAWWDRQSPEARKVLEDANSPGAATLEVALTDFNNWLKRVPDCRLWGNGVDFDNTILIAAYLSAGIDPGWKFYRHRCYRTVKNTCAAPKLARQGTHHNALDDAKSQAAHLIDIYKLNPQLLWR